MSNGWMEFSAFKIVSLYILSVLYVLIGPCNGIDSTDERAYLADRPTVGYRGVKVLIYKQSMQKG
jgi:hypothetical protein